jgi:putative acetyltransferase
MINYLTASTDEEYEQATVLFKEYAAWLNIDLSFQYFDDELLELKTMYAKPIGGIILCKEEREFIGCVGIRKIDNDIAELKRMFIKPAYQKQGTGKILLEKALELAANLNYKFIRLDTLNYMTPAISLYKNHGFYEIPAYYHNPNETAVYFELKLKA